MSYTSTLGAHPVLSATLCVIMGLIVCTAMADDGADIPRYRTVEPSEPVVEQWSLLPLVFGALPQVPPGYPVEITVRNTGAAPFMLRGGCRYPYVRLASGEIIDADFSHLKKKVAVRAFEVPGEITRVFCAWQPELRRMGSNGLEPLAEGLYAFLVRATPAQDGHPLEVDGMVSVPFEITQGEVLRPGVEQSLAVGFVGKLAGAELYMRPETVLRVTVPGGQHVWAATVRVFHDGAHTDVSLEGGQADSTQEAEVAGHRLRLVGVDAHAMTATFVIDP